MVSLSRLRASRIDDNKFLQLGPIWQNAEVDLFRSKNNCAQFDENPLRQLPEFIIIIEFLLCHNGSNFRGSGGSVN